MWQRVKKRKDTKAKEQEEQTQEAEEEEEEEEDSIRERRRSSKNDDNNEEEEEEEEEHPLIKCAELILPWLTPQELANISLTSKTLAKFSNSITLRRSLDASRSLEPLPIPFHNPHHHRRRRQPYAYFLYTPSQILLSQSPPRQPWGCCTSPVGGRGAQLSGVGGPCGCDCDGCGGGGGDELLLSGFEGLGIMVECGPSCGCGLACGNRLTQRGISVKLKIVSDERKGWCLFADQMIPRGHFVCEYAGELLKTEEARSRQQIYDELARGGRFSSALLVVREHLPSGKACLRINIDATRVGNVARFINHSCDGGNLLTVLVRSSGSLLPRICFFASKDIKEGEELSFSYGEVRVRSKGLQCFCGSSCCLGTLPSENT